MVLHKQYTIKVFNVDLRKKVHTLQDVLPKELSSFLSYQID